MVSSAEMIQTAIDSGIAARNATVPTSADPVVAEQVETAVAFAEAHHGDPGHVLSEILNDQSLTTAQKDDAIATLWEMANGQNTPYGAVSESAQEELRAMFEDIGSAWTGDYTAEFRSTVTESIGRSVDSGRLSEGEVYDLITDGGTLAPSASMRELLTDVTNAPVLDSIASQLVDDAASAGYEFTGSQNGASYLAAAADLANMAAERGWTGAAGEVLDEITRVESGNLTKDSMPITEQILRQTPRDWSLGLDARTGLAALSGVLNSANITGGARQDTADQVFATLVRSGDSDLVGGLSSHFDESAALNELGTYFSENVGRLADLDVRNFNTQGSTEGDAFYSGLVRDVFENVALNEDFDGQAELADALAAEVLERATVAGDPNASANDRNRAAQILGTLAGSLEQAAENHVAQAGEESAALRSLTDLVTDRIISRGSKLAGPVSGTVGTGANMLVDAIWQQVEAGALARANGEVDASLGDLRTMLADVRDALGDFDDLSLAESFDNRKGHYDPTSDGVD